MFARTAGHLLRILEHLVAVAIHRGILTLRVEVSAQHVDCIALVATDAAIDDLVRAFLRGETPTIARAHNGNGHRPRLVANHQHPAIRARLLQHVQRLHGRENLRPGGARCGAIGTVDDVLVFFAEDRVHRRIAVGLERGHQRVDPRLRRCESFLRSRSRGERSDRDERQRKPTQQ